MVDWCTDEYIGKHAPTSWLAVATPSACFDAVATDDARLIRHLRGLGVPHAVPAVLVVMLRQEGAMSDDEATQALSALKPHISADEYATAQLMLRPGDMP